MKWEGHYYMILLHNNYIFLPKTKKEDSSVSSKNTGNAIHLNIKKSISSYIKSIFGEPISKDKENIVFKITYTYEMEIESIKYNVVFTIHNITKYFYLDICVKGEKTSQVINALEYIQDKLVNSTIEKQYIMIVSYDSISEYYCNKAYPKLNKLERNLRKLLFNTYTVNFGVDYYQNTISQDLQKKIKGVIQAKGNEENKQIERNKKFFYSMEFSDIQALLFAKKWTKIDEKNKIEFLLKHEKLTELPEEELRAAFDEFLPRSDWERLFADKIDNCEIEKMIEMVRLTRNDIAHCKFFYKEEYLSFNESVTILNKLILKAIKLTEEKDFVKKQAEYYRVALIDLNRTLSQFRAHMEEIMYDSIESSLQSFSLAMNEWKNTLNKSFSKMISGADFNKDGTITDDELIDEDIGSENGD